MVELAVSRAFMKVFNTYSVDVINDCKLFMGIEPAHEVTICKRKRRFQIKYCSANNLIVSRNFNYYIMSDCFFLTSLAFFIYIYIYIYIIIYIYIYIYIYKESERCQKETI